MLQIHRSFPDTLVSSGGYDDLQRKTLPYRRDIDGLRGVAVLLVLLFHAKVGLPGGFVGVDIFFVISGYLITGILLKRHESQSLNLRDFWIRRIRRIIPALTVVTVATLVAGYFLLFTEDFIGLAKSVIAHQFMGANFYFWRTTNYFSPLNETQPLLHFWSLAVEEQFYLVFPLFMFVMLKRVNLTTLGWLLASVFLASLLASELAVRIRPVAAFYLLPTRMWELIAGSLICFLPLSADRRFASVAVYVGVILILGAVWTFNTNTSFPGINALFPVLGATLLIWGNGIVHTIIRGFLEWSPIRFVGLMSYSLYLWHWPLFVFVRYWLPEPTSISVNCGLLILCFGMGALSWQFVEEPVRNPVSSPRTKLLVLFSVLSMFLLILVGGIVIGTDGLPGRMSDRVRRYELAQRRSNKLYEVSPSDLAEANVPEFGTLTADTHLLLWGDSHAMVLRHGLDLACRDTAIHGFQVTNSITAPLLDFVYLGSASGLREKAPEFNREVVNFAIKREINIVVLAGKWSAYGRLPDFERQLRTTVDTLLAQGISVVLVKDVASGNSLSPRYLAGKAFWSSSDESERIHIHAHRERNKYCDSVIDSIAGRFERVCTVDPAGAFIDDDGFWQAEIDKQILYFDTNHLSEAGSIRLRGLFVKALKTLSQTR